MTSRVRNEVEIHSQLKHPSILEVIKNTIFILYSLLFITVIQLF